MRVPVLLGLAALVLWACDAPDTLPWADGAQEGCSVERVVDGDTVDLRCPGMAPVRARLVGFDTPEKFSPSCRSELHRALAAERHLRALVAGARIEASFRGEDRFGRALVRLWIDGADLADLMIDAGHARAYAGGPRRGWCT